MILENIYINLSECIRVEKHLADFLLRYIDHFPSFLSYIFFSGYPLFDSNFPSSNRYKKFRESKLLANKSFEDKKAIFGHSSFASLPSIQSNTSLTSMVSQQTSSSEGKEKVEQNDDEGENDEEKKSEKKSKKEKKNKKRKRSEKEDE